MSFFPHFIHEEGKEVQVSHGFVTDAIDGLGAIIAMGERETLKPGPLFESDVVQPKFKPEWLDEEELEAWVWNTLIAGTEVGGEKCSRDFSCLLFAIPLEEPAKDDLDHRLWDFISTSRDLLIRGKPLGSYFATRSTPTTGHESTPARQAMHARINPRRLATTPRGHLALVPASTQPGDAVLIYPAGP